MKTAKIKGFHLIIGGLLSLSNALHAQSSAFTYQGRLNDGATVTNGKYDLIFGLFGTNNGGSFVVGPLTNSSVVVSNGLFAIMLDFGNGAFPGADRWLEISVRTNGIGSYTALAPRQKISSAPYAVTASNITGVVLSGSLSGTYAGAVTFNNPANQFSGAFTGNAGGLTNMNASQLAVGTVPDPRLSANIALINANQTFSGSNTFSGATTLTNAANIFAGNFTGDAAGLTNLTGPNLSGFTTPENFGAVGGITDDTAAFQAALRSGKPVLAKATNYTVGNLYMTNNNRLIGYGTVLRFKAGVTNYMLDCGTNVNVGIQGLTLDAGDYTHPYPSWASLPSYGARHGVRVNSSGGGCVTDVHCGGFNGTAFTLIGTLPYTWTPTNVATTFAHNSAYECYDAFDIFSNVGATPEYFQPVDINATECVRGVFCTAGNVIFNSCHFTAGYYGAVLAAGQNGAHGIFSSCTFNHNKYPVRIDNVLTTEIFDACEFLAGGTIQLFNCAGIVFQNGTFSPDGMMVDGGGVNIVRNNLFIGTMPPVTNTANGGLPVVYGNINGSALSLTAADFDQQPLRNGGAGWLFTNLPVGVAPTIVMTNGSILTGTNGTAWLRSNNTWIALAGGGGGSGIPTVNGIGTNTSFYGQFSAQTTNGGFNLDFSLASLLNGFQGLWLADSSLSADTYTLGALNTGFGSRYTYLHGSNGIFFLTDSAYAPTGGELWRSGGWFFGRYDGSLAATDPGANNVIIQGNLTAGGVIASGAITLLGGNLSDLVFTENTTTIGRQAKGTLQLSTNLVAKGQITATNGIASYRSNLLAATSISVGASVFNWTNTQPYNIFVFIAGGTVTELDLNGGALSTSSLTGLTTLPLQPNEYVRVTYSVAPTKWHPF